MMPTPPNSLDFDETLHPERIPLARPSPEQLAMLPKGVDPLDYLVAVLGAVVHLLSSSEETPASAEDVVLWFLLAWRKLFPRVPPPAVVIGNVSMAWRNGKVLSEPDPLLKLAPLRLEFEKLQGKYQEALDLLAVERQKVTNAQRETPARPGITIAPDFHDMEPLFAKGFQGLADGFQMEIVKEIKQLREQLAAEKEHARQSELVANRLGKEIERLHDFGKALNAENGSLRDQLDDAQRETEQLKEERKLAQALGMPALPPLSEADVSALAKLVEDKLRPLQKELAALAPVPQETTWYEELCEANDKINTLHLELADATARAERAEARNTKELQAALENMRVQHRALLETASVVNVRELGEKLAAAQQEAEMWRKNNETIGRVSFEEGQAQGRRENAANRRRLRVQLHHAEQTALMLRTAVRGLTACAELVPQLYEAANEGKNEEANRLRVKLADVRAQLQAERERAEGGKP